MENFVTLDQQLFSITEQKSTLFEPSLENCVFLQSDNISLEGQSIGANLNVILPSAELDRSENTNSIVCYTSDKSCSKDSEGSLQLSASSNIILQDDLVLPNNKNSPQKEISTDISSLIPFASVVFKCSKCDHICTAFEEFEAHLKIHNKFMCQMCSESFENENDLQSHLLDHTLNLSDQEKSLVCSSCSLKFSSSEELYRHAEIHELNPQIEVIEIPKKDFQKKKDSRKRSGSGNVTLVSEEEAQALVEDFSDPSNLSLSEIALRQSLFEKKRLDNPKPSTVPATRTTYPNKCKFCPKSFRKPSDLLRHERTHTGERPYECFCGKTFAVKSSRTSHLQTHFKKSGIPCHVCGKNFSSPGSLKLHMRLHTGSKPFVCPECNAKFRTSGHLKAHMVNHTNRGKKNQSNHMALLLKEELVDDCEEIHSDIPENDDGARMKKGNSSKVNLDEVLEVIWDQGEKSNITGLAKGIHLRLTTSSLQSQDPPLSSIVSPQLTNNQLQPFKSSVNKIMSENFSCSKCKEIFSKKSLFEKHLKTHHSEDEVLSCKICKKKFDSSCELELHSLVHTLENELICPKCHLGFPEQESLAAHACTGKPAKSSSLLESASLDLSDLIFFTVPQ